MDDVERGVRGGDGEGFELGEEFFSFGSDVDGSGGEEGFSEGEESLFELREFWGHSGVTLSVKVSSL